MPSLNTVIKQASRGADLYFVFRFLRLLTMKWEKTDAFKYGIIDKKGKVLRKSSDLTTVYEKAGYTMLHRLVFKIRRLIEKIPIIGKTILTNYAAALFLLKEQNDTRIWTDEKYMGRKLMEFLENGEWEEEAELLREEIKNQYGFEESMSFLTEGKKDLPPHLQKLIKDLEKKQKELEKKGLKVKTFVYNPDTGKPDIELKERKMTDAEKDEKEKIVLSLKKKADQFKAKYGDDWENVMYATATKMAMGEEVDEAFYDKVTIPQINTYLRGLSRMLSNKDLIDHLKRRWNLKKIKFNSTYTKILAIEERDMKSFTEFQESTAEYAKSLEKIANDKKLKMLSSSERKNLQRIADLLDKEKKEEVEVDEAKNPNLTAGMECQECGKKFRAKLKTLEYGKTKCPKCKSTDLDFAYGAKNESSELDEKRRETPDEWMKRTGKKPSKVKGGTGKAGKKAVMGFKKKLGVMSKKEKELDDKEREEREKNKEKNEEIANSVGGGNIAGLGVGPQGEPGKPKKKKKKVEEAVQLGTFAGKQVFVVDSDTFHQCRLGKRQYARYEKYVGKNGVGLAIREYGLKFPKRPIILQNGENGPMLYLRYGRS